MLVGIGILLVGFVAISYVNSSATVFSNLNLISYGAGWEKVWLVLCYGADFLFLIIVLFCFAEILLWLIRTALNLAFTAQEKMTGNKAEKVKNNIKKISLFTLFKWLGVKKASIGAILYFSIILGVLLIGWIGKTVLKSTDSLVYRANELIHLESNLETFDLSDEIDSKNPVHLSISTNIGVIHLYTVSDTSEAKIYFLYDTEAQLTDYTITYINDSFTIFFNDDVEEYFPYQEPVLPSVEIYLPETLVLGNVDVTIENYGYLITEYFGSDSMEIEAVNTEISIKASTEVAFGALAIHASNSNVRASVKRAESINIDLDQSEASLSFGSIQNTAIFDCNQSDVLFHTSNSSNLTVVGDLSKIEIRDVYSPEVSIDIKDCTLLFYNSDADYSYTSFSIIGDGNSNQFFLKGVPEN